MLVVPDELAPSADVTVPGRLRLRRATPHDLEVVYAIHSDPRTNIHNPAGPDRRWLVGAGWTTAPDLVCPAHRMATACRNGVWRTWRQRRRGSASVPGAVATGGVVADTERHSGVTLWGW